jgi:predicted lipid-binding transport protein (Tim44 family)
MKLWLITALSVALVAAALPDSAEAKRLGAGKAAGTQRNMPARTAPDAPPAKPAQAPQAAPTTPAAGAAAAPAAAPKRNWMGPLAGLAAGLGIAALFSQLGLGGALGGALGSIFTMLLLAGAAFFLIRFLMRRFGPNAQSATPALAGAGAGSMGGTQVAWPQKQAQEAQPMLRQGLDSAAVATPGATAPAGGVPVTANPQEITRVFVPASFDSEGFTRTAKMIFIRLQTANDTADLDDLRRFTTPELFSSLRLDIQERGPAPQHTDVVKVDAEVLDVADEGDRQVVSVRFHGQVVEEKGAAPSDFNEVWHLVKPHDDSRSWAIAGIEQMS